jgi:hypothetical protein
MFVRNDTSCTVALAKGHIADTFAAGSLVVETAYRASQGGLTATGEPVKRGPGAPPDTQRLVLWREVSVTASGVAHGPPHAPYVRPVTLTVGDQLRRLIVFGPRRYIAASAGLEPSAPGPFDATPLSWDRAFGGGYDVPPGLMPGSLLPHPGFRVEHAINRFGRGYYADERAARDMPLPEIERPDQLIRKWSEQPTPAGFAPCPDLHALRLPQRYGGHGPELFGGSSASDPTEAMLTDAPRVALRTQHHAPGDLIFRTLPLGTPITLVGLSGVQLRFEVPASPISVRTRRLRQEELAPPRLRSIHIDADLGIVTIVYGHDFAYDPDKPPSWILVSAGG